RGRHEEGPAERREPGDRDDGEHNCWPGTDGYDGPARRHHGRHRAAHGTTASSRAAATAATVSQCCGAMTFATWGANAGDATTTSAVAPSATMSPSAS